MKRRWLAIATFLVVIGIGYAGIHWANQPTSTSQSHTGKTDAAVLGSSSDLKPFVSPYFSTQIPADMLQKTSNENPRAAIRASYLFTSSKTSPGDQAAISVGTMGLSQLSEISGVKQRLNDPDMYQPTTIANAPQGAVAFTRSESYETAVFWQENNSYVAVVVSGSPLRQAELDQTLQAILTNWSWL